MTQEKKLFNEVKANEVEYFVNMGWLKDNGDGTHSLTEKGEFEANRQLEAEVSKKKVLYKFLIDSTPKNALDLF